MMPLYAAASLPTTPVTARPRRLPLCPTQHVLAATHCRRRRNCRWLRRIVCQWCGPRCPPGLLLGAVAMSAARTAVKDMHRATTFEAGNDKSNAPSPRPSPRSSSGWTSAATTPSRPRPRWRSCSR
ncbi:hypothetical protein D5H75_40545 [Bailinhaonella thermotolerans]|uniref:Uncharacterized protein n=1 Tax=Bailinhaonella thermotolerans TaxID=1070861 RepID=A0A3A3ZZ97_9ACTN|nr:hypothetical protein D5H75_40545 [Bailinhaonella thermotolerans]